MALEDLLYELVHQGEHHPKRVSAETGIPYSTLLRQASPTDEGAPYQLKNLVPVMNVQENYNVLDFLAKVTGHLLIKMPRGIRKGADPNQSIQDYQVNFNQMVTKLIRFIQNPTDETFLEVEKAMRRHIGESVNWHKRIKNNLIHQNELDF